MPFARIAITLPKELLAASSSNAISPARLPSGCEFAEEAGRLAKSRRPRRAAVQQIIGFDSYEDFDEWKRANRG